MTDHARPREDGLIHKFHVARVDGRDQPGGDRQHARYFVLDYAHDESARSALRAYADRAWWRGHTALAEDLWAQLRSLGMEFTTPPESQEQAKDTARRFKARHRKLYGDDPDKWPKPYMEGR